MCPLWHFTLSRIYNTLTCATQYVYIKIQYLKREELHIMKVQFHNKSKNVKLMLQTYIVYLSIPIIKIKIIWIRACLDEHVYSILMIFLRGIYLWFFFLRKYTYD